MKTLFRKNNFLIAVFFLLVNFSFAEEGQTKWKQSSETPQAFIENKGQFDASVLYCIDDNGFRTNFTKTGITFSLTEKKHGDIKEEKDEHPRNAKERKEREEREHEAVIQKDRVSFTWRDANPNVEITASEPTDDYYSYCFKQNRKEVNKNFIRGYKKIVYKNLYNNIDVEYSFHPSRAGYEYTFILHPGADASKIKMKYSRNVEVDLNGNVLIPTSFGNITDLAPVTNYSKEKNLPVIASHFVKNGKEISFVLAPYDNTKEVLIDPWTITPSNPNSNKIWEIETDEASNVYVYAGDWPVWLRKYNSSGGIVWSLNTGYDSSSWIGTMKTDPSGNTYITQGSTAAIKKVNTAGGQVWSNTGGFADEYWSIAFNCDYTQLVIGGTRLVGLFQPTGDGKAFNINMTNGAVLNSVTVAKTVPSFFISDINEIRSICASPNGNFYFHTLDTVGCLTPAFGINFRLLTTYSYAYGSPSWGFTPQPQHTIAASSNYIYTMNGATLFRRNIANGTVVNSVAIPGGSFTTPLFVQGISPNNNGLVLDSCGNVYVGSGSQVHKYDAALNLIASANTPSAVYDVAINRNGEVVACGQGFIASLNLNSCNPVQPICVTSTLSVTATHTNNLCHGSCTATATASPNGGTLPYTYSWTGGQTTQIATGLCAGSYTVTVTDASSNISTASVTVTEPTALTSSLTSQTNILCNGASTGSATVSASGGSASYTYTWTPSGGNSATAAGLSAGTYTCTITDANGCATTQTATITQPTTLSSNISSTNVVCFGNGDGSTTVTASGGTGAYIYLWSPAGGTGATATGLTAGTYSVTITDANGCTTTNSVTVTEPTAVTATVTSTEASCSSCADGTATATPLGGIPPYGYLWNTTPQQVTATATGLSPGTYIVCVSDLLKCEDCDTITITWSTGINNLNSSADGIFIYPNPNDGKFEIRNMKSEIEKVEIFNSIGEKVYDEKIKNQKSFIVNQNLSSGIYLVKIYSDGKVFLKKILVE